MDSEETKEIISILGKEKAEELYNYIGSKKISPAKLHKFIQDEQICEDLKSNKISFSDLAKKYRVSLMTIYRLFHRLKKGFNRSDENVK